MPAPSLKSQKISLRQSFRALRRDVGVEVRQRLNQAINARVEELASELGARRVTGFLAFDGEPDISPALERLNRKGVEVYLPVIGVNQPGNALSFRRWPTGGGESRPGELRKNSFGIQEPVVGDGCPVQDIDLMLIPLVAWDEQGGRLGMGAGYYDRALGPVAAKDHPRRIGVAYDIQRAESVPMARRDVRLHGAVTESGLFTCVI